jgi:hypothetical protein
MKQRIALVAVSALTAGLFSVVSTPAANAVVNAAETLTFSRTNSTTGAPVGAAAGIAVELMKNIGVVSLLTGTGTDANTSANLLFVGGQSSTGSMLASGTIAVAINSATQSAITVSGGRIIEAPTKVGGTPIVNGSNTEAVILSANGMGVLISPTGAVGSTMTIQGWTGAGIAALTPTNGILAGTVTFTIVASGSAGVFSAGDSNVSTQVQQVKGTACTAAATFDDVASIVNGSTACIHVNPKDIYGTAVTTGTITASATNSAKVLVSAANAAAGFLAAAPFSSAPSAANLYVVVIPATAGVGQTTTVTLTWNGVVIGTKNITFQGDIAKLTFVAASSKTNYKNGSTAIAADGGLLAVAYVATDALGQAVTLAAGPTISDATGAMTPAVLNNTNNGVIGVLQTAALGGGASAVTIASNALVGAGTFRIKLTNAAGVDIKSDVINATVSTGAATFTAAWDKASYSPGEIAVLTITAKDSGGRGVAQGVAFGTNAAITINTDGFTSLTVACDTLSTQTVKGTDGSRTCNYAVKNTAGAYAYSVSVPTSSAQSAIGGTLKINADTTAVSNADVLKSIVALIASINKQIQALQKLILKR